MVRLKLTDEHIALIRNIRFEKFYFNPEDKITHHYSWGIDEYNLLGGSSYILESIALILGHYDKFIPGTEEDPMGRQYPKELEEHWWELYRYIWENISEIMELVLFTCGIGGIEPGEYTREDTGVEWKRV